MQEHLARSPPPATNLMDDQEIQDELENLAGNAFDPDFAQNGVKIESIATTIARWKKLFNLNEDAAIDRIMEHRNDLTRARVSASHWESVRSYSESHGYDREAYEYELGLLKTKAAMPLETADSGVNGEDDVLSYLVELSAPLDSAEKVQKAIGLRSLPEVVSGSSVEEEREMSLCCIDGAARAALLRWAADEGGGFKPTILVDPRSMR